MFFSQFEDGTGPRRFGDAAHLQRRPTAGHPPIASILATFDPSRVTFVALAVRSPARTKDSRPAAHEQRNLSCAPHIASFALGQPQP